MDETRYIWKDGKLIDWHEAETHVLAHSLHYGAGVFEGVRFYKTEEGTAVFRLKEHLERLFYSAKAISMTIPFSKEELISAVKELIKENNLEHGYIRPIAYFGYGKMGLNPTGAPVNTVIAAWPWGAYLGDKPVRVKVSKFIRIHPASTISDAKITGHYVNSILASQEVHAAGYDEALFLDYCGKVAEGPGENIFMVKDNKLITPAKGSILLGITRASVIALAQQELGLEVIEKDLDLEELQEADEAFFTGTAAEVTAISEINEKKIKDGKLGPVTKKIKELFLEVVAGKVKKYASWLTFVNE